MGLFNSIYKILYPTVKYDSKPSNVDFTWWKRESDVYVIYFTCSCLSIKGLGYNSIKQIIPRLNKTLHNIVSYVYDKISIQ